MEESLHKAKEQMEAANWELALSVKRANQLALEAEAANRPRASSSPT